MDLNERDTRAKALEGHLHAARAEVQTLTQQFGNIKEALDMVQRELKQSYRLCMDLSKRYPAARHTASSANPRAPVHRYKGGSQSLLPDTSQVSFQKTSAAAEGTELIQTNPEVTHEVTLQELNRMARNIPAFTPELAGDPDVHAYVRDIDFFLHPEVRRFLARQPRHIQSDYQQLRQAIIKEFSDPESEHGLIAALATKQGRLQRAYFGAHNEPGLEENTSFKSLFLQNLHPMVSHHLGMPSLNAYSTTA
ncbi:Protein NDRG1-B [Labeo rohita]|uniref:Protein NDRG1-B n=1 Tax=Labeo rohita TaxID=84645 RepID=A0ABQ8LZD6_LABRO|nr:Protein NDRG1-B [Labeo rohita]